MADGPLSDLLCTASASGDLSEVNFLLQNGAHVNGCNIFQRTALQVVMLGHSGLVDALLSAGAQPNARDPVLGLTVTHDAAREGFADTVRVLLTGGADVNLADHRGNLPLHLAAREGHLEVVQVLIEHTADPRATNSLGYTAWQMAHEHGRMETAACIEEYLNAH